MAGPYANILETVGNTPIVRLNRLAPDGVNVFVKIESFNPMGSVKDRLALSVIEQAEKDGTLSPGQTVVEEPGQGGDLLHRDPPIRGLEYGSELG